MAPSSADPQAIALIRRLVETPRAVLPSRQAQSDLMAHGLKVQDVCQAIADWIDAGERVKPTKLHSFAGRVGQLAYEMKPRLGGVLYYIKVVIDDRGGSAECLVLLSAHPDH